MGVRSDELDDRLRIAMLTARRVQMSHWLHALNEHRGCGTFRTQESAYDRTWGFVCSCSGAEQEWSIHITALRDALPEAREAVQRIFRHRRTWGSKAKRRDERKADRRAKALLHRYLTREQRWDLRASKSFQVTGQDGRQYQITEGNGGNVRMLENGEPSVMLCVVSNHRVTSLPIFDLLLAQKVLLENHIEYFLRTARARDLKTETYYESAGYLLGEAPRFSRPPVGAVPLIDIPEQDLEDPAAWAVAQLNNQGDPDGHPDRDPSQ